MNKKDFIFISILASLGIFLRSIFYKVYPLDGDGFLYLRFARDKILGNEFLSNVGYFLGEPGLILFLCILTILSIILFYFLCRQYANELNSFIAGLFFALSPLVFSHSYFGMVDKDIPSIFMIILILLLTKTLQKNIRLQVLVILGLFIIFAYVWQGWVFLALFYLLYYGFTLNGKFWRGIFTGSLIGLFFIFGLGIFKYFTTSPDKTFIRELNPIWMISPFSEYIIFIVVYLLIILAFKDYKEQFKKDFLFEAMLFFYAVIGMIFIFRIGLFALVICYMMLALFLEHLNITKGIKYWSCVICLLFIVLTSFNIYNISILYDPAIKEASLYMNTQDTSCVIGMWDKGTIYEYFTNKTAYYKGYASNYKEIIGLMATGEISNINSCTMIWNTDDLLSLRLMLKHDGQNISNTTPLYIETLQNKNFTFLTRTYYVSE